MDALLCLELPFLPVNLPIQLAAYVENMMSLCGSDFSTRAFTAHGTEIAIKHYALFAGQPQCVMLDGVVRNTLCLQQGHINVCEVLVIDAILLQPLCCVGFSLPCRHAVI